MKYTDDMPTWPYEPYPTSGDPDEFVPVVRYLRARRRPTVRALRAIAAGRLQAEQRTDGWWVQVGPLEELLSTQERV